jgi:hypothetical protein
MGINSAFKGLNWSIQNKLQFYSDLFYRTALYFKNSCRQKLQVASLVFLLWQTPSKISIFYCRLVFREFHSTVQMSVRSIVKFGTSCRLRPIFVVRSSVLKSALPLCVCVCVCMYVCVCVYVCVYVCIYMYIYVCVYVCKSILLRCYKLIF